MIVLVFLYRTCDCPLSILVIISCFIFCTKSTSQNHFYLAGRVSRLSAEAFTSITKQFCEEFGCTESALTLPKRYWPVLLLATVSTTEALYRSSSLGTKATVERKVVSNRHSLCRSDTGLFVLIFALSDTSRSSQVLPLK